MRLTAAIAVEKEGAWLGPCVVIHGLKGGRMAFSSAERCSSGEAEGARLAAPVVAREKAGGGGIVVNQGMKGGQKGANLALFLGFGFSSTEGVGAACL